MKNNTRSIQTKYRTRSSLAKPNNSQLSYKKRIALSGKSKDDKGVDFSNPIDSSGYISLN
ncbi:hypothetical protein AAFX15_15385 [Vibrio chagasii]|uniref:hypothetical protein n=1 Tax=Vibrio chagasii TaxID=170679 RepID=UPI0038CE90A0